MKIIPATKDQTQLLHTFIQPYEHTCAGLAAIIRRFSEPIYIISNVSEITKLNEISGIFSFKHSIFHCLPDLSVLDSEFEEAFINIFLGKKINSIIGKRDGTEILFSILQKADFQTEQQVFYKLMTLTAAPNKAPEPLCNGDEIRRCLINNLEELHPLQKDYLEKEIAPAGRHITDLETKANLKQILKNQICFALYSNDEPVAKVNTNAIGFDWVQIGGVYTHPLYRHNYYAWHLLYVLCFRIIKANHTPCLFVKEKNTGAFNLYERIGFQEIDKFAIFYIKNE